MSALIFSRDVLIGVEKLECVFFVIKNSLITYSLYFIIDFNIKVIRNKKI